MDSSPVTDPHQSPSPFPSQIDLNAALSDSDNVSSDEENFEPESEPTRPALVMSSVPVPEPGPLIHSPSDDALRPIAKLSHDDDDHADADDDTDDLVLEEGGEKAEFSDTDDVFVEASGGDDEDVIETAVAVVDDELELSDDNQVLHAAAASQFDDDDGVSIGGTVEGSQFNGLHSAEGGVSLDTGFHPIQNGAEEFTDKVLDGGDYSAGQNVDHAVDSLVLGGPGDTGVPEHGLNSDIDVPPEEGGGGSEFAEIDEKMVEGDVVEREIGSYVDEGDNEVEVGHGEIDGENGVHEDRLNIDIDLPREEGGGGSEFVEKDEKKVEDHVVEREIGSYVKEGDNKVEVGHGEINGENGVHEHGLNSDIVVPPEEGGGGSEFAEIDEKKVEGDVVEREIGSYVEKGDNEVDVGHREIDGENGVHEHRLNSDIDVPPEEGDGGLEFAEIDEKKAEGGVVEREIGSYVEEGDNEVDVGNREIDGENGVHEHGLNNDIVVPPEEGDGGSEFAEIDEKKVEGDVVEREIDSYVEEGDNEVDVGYREIDGAVSQGKIESHVEEVGDGEINGSEGVVFLKDLELQQSRASGSSRDDERIDGQIVTESDEEEETDDEGDGKELFDTATLAALLKAASGADQDDGSITITSQDGSRVFSVERPAGLGSSLQSGKPAMRPTRPSLFTPSITRASAVPDANLSEEEKKKLEKLQEIRVKYLRLVHRLGFTTEESIAAQVLYRLTLVAGRQSGQIFSLESAKETAFRLEDEGRDDFDFSVNILVLGKAGVGKSATINSIFGETKTTINAFGPATTAVKEIVGVIDGVKIRIFDTPGLKSSAFEQNFNTKVLSRVKKLTKKSPPDIVLYVDRLDLQTRDMNDLPMLRSITSVLGSSIWRNVIVTLTHAASAPPDGPSGAPLSYDVFVAQRSHIVQQTIGQAVGDLRLMNPSLMNPVSLAENHPSCRKNRDGQKVLPNGQSWRPLLLLLCFSMKILSEASNASKAQESFDHRRLFGFRPRSPPLPYLLSWLLQSRTYPKLPADQGGADNGDSDIEIADLSDSDLDEDEDEYDQLPPFKPMKKSQVAKLTKEQQKAYFEEYDYRVKLLQKKQWRDELRRMREMKKKGNTKVNDYAEEDDQDNGSPAAVPVPLPDMAMPPSFDSDNPAYRYRFLEPTSQLLTRPVLDNHGWDHDCGYDGVNIEQSLAIINKFPASVTVQVTKDKKDFSIHLDSSVAAKLGENGSAMAGFDIQNIGKQLAYIVRGETKFKNLKRNKTSAGVSVTFLGENVSTGVKVEDQIAVGKRLVLVGSTGIVKSQADSAYGANLEVRLREADFPIGQDQSSLSLSLVKWRGDLALGANLQSQISFGRSYKVAVRAGLNNKLSGQITVRTSSSDQLQLALIAILPIAKSIYKNFWPGASENYSIY